MANRGINKVILIGNLGKDPEIRYMPSGGAVANITLATSENWKDKNTGENKEKVEWHRVVIFGKLAEISGQFLKKGTQVYIEGSLQTRKWKDKNGMDRYTTEIIVNMTGKMQMLGSRISNDQNNLIKHPGQGIKNDKSVSKKQLLDSNNTNHTLQTEISNIDFDEDLPF